MEKKESVKALRDVVRMEHIAGEARLMAEDLGLDLFLTLVEAFPGRMIYIPTGARLIMYARDQEIRRRRAAGSTFRQLSREFGLGERQIRKIVNNEGRN